MNRALRRHPGATKAKQQPVRPIPPTKQPRRRGPQEPAPRTPLAFLRPRWAEEIISELRKVTWPTREETFNLTLVVIVVTVIVGAFLGGVDMLFSWIINHTLLR